jgi:ribosomal-protein-alanine N-acetyltransferase
MVEDLGGVAPEQFATARLRAERIAAGHRADLRRMHQEPRMMATVGGVWDEAATAAYLERNVAHWAAHGFGIWILRDRDDSRLVGHAGLRHLDVEGSDEVEVGYGLLPEYWGRGLATEIARECVAVARDHLGLPSLVAIALPDNRASQRVLAKVGLAYEREVGHAGVPHMLYRIRFATPAASAGAAGR